MSTTIYNLCSDIPQINEHGHFDIGAIRKGERIPSVVSDLTPRRPPTTEGLHDFTPEELLFLRVPLVEVNGRVIGYQRPFQREDARKKALAMLAGKPFPEIQVAVDGNGVMYVVDGQHRSVAGVIARRVVPGVVRRRTLDEQRELFAGQRKARPVDRNVLILAGSSSYERYIQEAVADEAHPWGKIVSANPKSQTRISPYAMLRLLMHYVGNATGTAFNPSMEERWNRGLSDEFAPMIACWGDKKANPLAFKPIALHGVGAAAMYIFRRNKRVQAGDRERWLVHMPKFAWEKHAFVRTGADFTFHLVNHWNKRLHDSRKIRL